MYTRSIIYRWRSRDFSKRWEGSIIILTTSPPHDHACTVQTSIQIESKKHKNISEGFEKNTLILYVNN